MPIYARTNMTGAITDADLAYLNENLDIVTDYLYAMCNSRFPQAVAIVAVIVKRKVSIVAQVNVHVVYILGTNGIYCSTEWQTMLAHVKKHANTASYVLK